MIVRHLNLRIRNDIESGRVYCMWIAGRYVWSIYRWPRWRWHCWSVSIVGVVLAVRLGRYELQIHRAA